MAVDLTELESLLDGLNGLSESDKFKMSEALFLEAFKTQNIKNNAFAGLKNLKL